MGRKVIRKDEIRRATAKKFRAELKKPQVKAALKYFDIDPKYVLVIRHYVEGYIVIVDAFGKKYKYTVIEVEDEKEGEDK